MVFLFTSTYSLILCFDKQACYICTYFMYMYVPTYVQVFVYKWSVAVYTFTGICVIMNNI